MRDSQISLGDGRTLAYTDIGDPAHRCLIFCHGAPMSRLHLLHLEERFASHGLRAVTPDRPGYGRSSPQLGRSVADWPDDVAALAGALGLDRFLVAGHSTGGAYAVACAALLGQRILGTIVLGGVTDLRWPPAWAGYLEGRKEIAVMQASDEAAALALAVELFGADGTGFLEAPFDFPAPDAALFADAETDRALSAAIGEGFAQGTTAYAQDAFLEGHGWPFDPGRIETPVILVRGDEDTLLPAAHLEHTAELIPHATVLTLGGHGHLTIVAELPRIAGRLVPAG